MKKRRRRKPRSEKDESQLLMAISDDRRSLYPKSIER
jgi:hypothetical protein